MVYTLYTLYTPMESTMLNLVNIQQVLNDYENLKNELSRIIYLKHFKHAKVTAIELRGGTLLAKYEWYCRGDYTASMEIPFCFLGKSDEEISQLFEEEDRIIAEERAKAREIQLQKDKEEQRELQELDRLQKKYHG